MLIGYARISKADGSQSLDLQRDALIAAGVPVERIYEDQASGARDDRPGLEACLRSLAFCDEIVIVDSGSSDGTLDIAEQYGKGMFSLSGSWIDSGAR